MNKTETYTIVTAQMNKILSDNKINKKTQAALLSMIDTHLKPKVGGGVRNIENPPKLDDDGFISEAYCKYYQRYMAAELMNISFRGTDKEKYRGESLLGAARYRAITQEIKTLNEKSMELILSGDVEGAQAAAKEGKDLTARRLIPTTEKGSLYDYDRDVKMNAPETSDDASL